MRFLDQRRSVMAIALVRFVFLALAMGLTGALARATSCTSSAELTSPDREALTAATARLSAAIGSQDFATLQASLLPAEAGDWQNIHDEAELASLLVKDGKITPRVAYLLDATSLTAPTDTEFFCSDASGSMVVTVSFRSLPPGRYAVVLADAVGAPLAGQLGFVLAWDNSWKLGGLTARPGVLGGHDALWYWNKARDLAKGGNNDWSAWYYYEAARYLEVPVDFLTSPGLQKLAQEQSQLKNTPVKAFPYTLNDGARIWTIDSIRLDTSLREADLGVTYESTGSTDTAVARVEAQAVLSALLKAQPGLRENLHGMWAYAQKDGKRIYAIELPMSQIP